MRAIKFRGKETSTPNRWFYGLYYEDNDGSFIWDKGKNTMWPIEVDPATVGQFTGLHDKNGKEIYDGDIVELRQPDGTLTPCEVSMCEKGYWSISFDIHERVILGFVNPNQIEVIGNIHDNPELLKKK